MLTNVYKKKKYIQRGSIIMKTKLHWLTLVNFKVGLWVKDGGVRNGWKQKTVTSH